jgi:hypothetical protein
MTRSCSFGKRARCIESGLTAMAYSSRLVFEEASTKRILRNVRIAQNSEIKDHDLPSVLPTRWEEGYPALVPVTPMIFVLPDDGKIERRKCSLVHGLRSHVQASQRLESVTSGEKLGYDGDDLEGKVLQEGLADVV